MARENKPIIAYKKNGLQVTESLETELILKKISINNYNYDETKTFMITNSVTHIRFENINFKKNIEIYSVSPVTIEVVNCTFNDQLIFRGASNFFYYSKDRGLLRAKKLEILILKESSNNEINFYIDAKEIYLYNENSLKNFNKKDPLIPLILPNEDFSWTTPIPLEKNNDVKLKKLAQKIDKKSKTKTIQGKIKIPPTQKFTIKESEAYNEKATKTNANLYKKRRKNNSSNYVFH